MKQIYECYMHSLKNCILRSIKL